MFDEHDENQFKEIVEAINRLTKNLRLTRSLLRRDPQLRNGNAYVLTVEYMDNGTVIEAGTVVFIARVKESDGKMFVSLRTEATGRTMFQIPYDIFFKVVEKHTNE
jgi:hypothetical protein